MALIFVSYDSQDSDVVRPLASALRTAGLRTWIYEDDCLPGPSYLEQVVRVIQEADVVVIVLSPESLRSGHVKRELFRAYEAGKGLLPILRELTHAAFEAARPDFHLALATNVAIRIPPEGIDGIITRVLAGIEALLNQRLDATTLRREVTGHPGSGNPAATSDDPWADLTSRLSCFPAEIIRMRSTLERAWDEMTRRASATHGWRSLASNRVRLVDEVVREVLDHVIEQQIFTPRDVALIARGGYGRGFLSEGSDVDITLLFGRAIPDEAAPFWARFELVLTDVINAVPCIRVSPLATTVAACGQEWQRVFSQEDPVRLASFASFAYSRHLAGSFPLHEQLRQRWREVATGAGRAEIESLVGRLRERIDTIALDPMTNSFHLKNDAGGVLEFRLIGFIEQFLSCRAREFTPDVAELAQAHEFFLVLRDQVERTTHTPLIARSDVERLRTGMERETGGETNGPELWNRLMRHRLRIRAGFKAAVEALVGA